jgi:hypothetical protein
MHGSVYLMVCHEKRGCPSATDEPVTFPPTRSRSSRQDVYDRVDHYCEARDTDLDMTEEQFRAGLNPRHNDSGLDEAIVEDWLERKSRTAPVDPDTLYDNGQPTHIHFGGHSGD